MKIDEFLSTVVTTPSGYFLLSTRDPDHGWQEYWYNWPGDKCCLLSDVAKHIEFKRDVYFSSHLFSERDSHKEYVLPTRTVQADLDYADVMTLPVLPTVVVNTSPLRHQSYWVMDEAMNWQDLEVLSRRVAYGTRDCDRTGWPAGHRMRLPGTRNFKYTPPAPIEITGHTIKKLDPEAFYLFPDLAITVAQADDDTTWINQDHKELGVGPVQLMHDAGMPHHIITAYTTASKDRSKSLWALMQAAFRAGLNRDQVYHLAWYSPNNKFKDDRAHSAIKDLRKDILRAEAVALDRELDVKAAIMDLRLKRGGAVPKRLEMAGIVIARMREDGELIHTNGGQLWFMPRDTGRPIEINEHSQWFDAYLQRRFTLNPVEADAKFVKAEIINRTRNQAPSSDLTALSYYEPTTNTLLLHTGGRDVLHISANGVETHPNGYSHAVFRVDGSIEPFRVGHIADLNGRTWYETLFGPQLAYLDGALNRDEALALLRSWFLFLLFRTFTTNRPILAFLGTQGSGKTTTGKMLYRLLYGHFRDIHTVRTEDKFDLDTINLPFVCYDGVDTFEKWLPSALSQAAGNSEVLQRVLYKDTDVIRRRRQAMIMLTSHNPHFTREDVVDRLLIIMLKRRPVWGSETLLLEELSSIRNALWADIVRDLQSVLATPKPENHEIPQFRIEDYAHYGLWFASAEGLGDVFTNAINKLVGTQRGVNLEVEQLLITTIEKMLRESEKRGRAPEYKSQSALWAELMACAPDPLLFQRIYRSALVMGRKLSTMQDSLKQIFTVDVEYDAGLGARQWRIGRKGAGT